MDGFVYVIITKDLRIKVGQTWRLDLRFRQLRRSVGEFYHYGHYKSDNYKSLEYQILREIRDKIKDRGCREVFQFSPIILKIATSKKGFIKGEDFEVVNGY